MEWPSDCPRRRETISRWLTQLAASFVAGDVFAVPAELVADADRDSGAHVLAELEGDIVEHTDTTE